MELPMSLDTLRLTDSDYRRRAQLDAAWRRDLRVPSSRTASRWTTEGCRVLGRALVQMGVKLQRYAARQAL